MPDQPGAGGRAPVGPGPSAGTPRPRSSVARRRTGPRHAAAENGPRSGRSSWPWPLAALAVVVLAGARALAAPVRPGEGTGAGPAAVALSPESVAGAHVAVWSALTGAIDRHGSLAPAGRELLLAAAALGGLLAWALAARLRLSGPACAVAVLLTGLPTLLPATALLDRAGQLAVPWLLAAAGLAVSGRRVRLALAAAAAAVAVLLAPDVLLLLAGGAVGALATGRGRLPRRARAAQVAGGAAAGVVLALLLPSWDAGSPAREVLGTAGALVLAAVLVGVGGLAGAGLPGLRGPAVAVVVTAAVATVEDRLAGLLVTLPVAALLAAALLDRAGARVSARSGPRRALLLAGAAALLALAAVPVAGLLRTPEPEPGPSAGPGAPTAAEPAPAALPAGLLEWLGAALPDGARVAAPPELRAELLTAGIDPALVPEVPPPTTDPAAPVLAVVREVPPGARLVARFERPGSGDAVLVVDPAPVEPTPEELDRRRALAAAILANPTTRAEEPVAAVLRSAEVDQRLLSLIGSLTAREGVGLRSFPVPPGEEDGAAPVRQVVVDTVGGRPVPADPAATGRLLAWLEAQLPPFAADRVEVTDDGVLVGFRYVSGADALVSARAP